MDILLVNPGTIRHDYITEHLGIASLKSYVNSKGFTADTLDMAIEALSVNDAVRVIFGLSPKIVGLSLLDNSKDKGIALAKALRKAGYSGKIVAGGYFPTFSSNEILRDFPEIDFVVRGEGELTLVELLEATLLQNGCPLENIAGLSFRQNGKTIENSARPLIQNLDVLPPIDRKYAAPVLQSGSHLRISGTRGCWGQCSFCDIIGFYRSSKGKVWRGRSIKHLVDEIELLVQKYQTNYFVFNDDQFLLKGGKGLERAEDFAGELERRKLNIRFEMMCRADAVNRPAMRRLQSAGLKRVFLGLESFDDKQLRHYHKNISVRQNLKALITLYRLKIDVVASVILANAYTTLWDLVKQFIMLFELKRRYFNSPNCRISINKKIEIYRGGAIYREYRQKGLLTKDNYLTGYDYKLKFWTGFRLGLFGFEEKVSRFLLKPAAVITNAIKSTIWSFNQAKSILFSYFKYRNLTPN